MTRAAARGVFFLVIAAAAVAQAQAASFTRMTGRAVEATFVSTDEVTGVTTTVTVFSTTGTVLTSGTKGGPAPSARTSLTMVQTDETGFLLAAQSDDTVVPAFNADGTVTLSGSFLWDVETTTTTSEEGTIDLTFTPTGRAVAAPSHELFLLPGVSVEKANVRGSTAPATATGTVTLDGQVFVLETDNAEIQTNDRGTIIVQPRS